MSEFELNGVDGFLRLSKALKEAGRTEVRKELNAAIREAAKPITPLSRAAARERLPHRGGLAEEVASAPQRVQTRTGRSPGVRIVVGKGRGGRGADRGRLRHPVFGNREVWVEQAVKPGWFTEAAMAQRTEVVRHIDEGLLRVVERIAKEVR